MFQDIKLPKTNLGNLRSELVEEFGFNMEVILPATHDTGSAFISSVCNDEDSVYLSSGTWSLMGVENRFPICVPQSMNYNFTNEGGIDYKFRFLKNIMGLWIIQEVKRVYKDKYSFQELVIKAKEVECFKSIIDVNQDRFLNPENMITEIQDYCKETNQDIPKTPGQVAYCVFNSLGISYRESIKELEEIFEKKYERINVFGGGCQNELLNQLIADRTNKEVLAGPVEATAIGNIAAQLLSFNKVNNLGEARELILNSFEIKKYLPK